MGRPSKYTEKLSQTICERLGNGESLVQICRSENMPHRSTVMRWLAADADFAKRYAQAHEWQADFYADQIIEIADEDQSLVRLDRHYGKDKKQRNGTATDGNYIEAVFDAAAVARNKLRIDARKWKAAKLAPIKYSDKVMNEHSGVGGSPMAVVTSNVTPEQMAEVVRNVRDKF